MSRPLRRPRAPWYASVAVSTGVALVMSPGTGLAHGPAPAEATPDPAELPASTSPAPSTQGTAENPPRDPPAEPEASAAPDGSAPEAADDPAPAPVATTGEDMTSPEVTGAGSDIIDANDPNATRATAELEGETLDDALPPGVPERMPPLRQAAWWTMFGTVALGTAGGVFAGLTEREEARAIRISRTFDPLTGSRSDYADVRDDYRRAQRRGEAYAWTSRGLLIGGGALLVASVTLFAVAEHRARREARYGRGGRRARIGRIGPGTLEVHF